MCIKLHVYFRFGSLFADCWLWYYTGCMTRIIYELRCGCKYERTLRCVTLRDVAERTIGDNSSCVEQHTLHTYVRALNGTFSSNKQRPKRSVVYQLASFISRPDCSLHLSSYQLRAPWSDPVRRGRDQSKCGFHCLVWLVAGSANWVASQRSQFRWNEPFQPSTNSEIMVKIGSLDYEKQPVDSRPLKIYMYKNKEKTLADI